MPTSITRYGRSSAFRLLTVSYPLGDAGGPTAAHPGSHPRARETGSCPRKAFEFVRANQARFPIANVARLLGVSLSGYYAWRDRDLSPRRQYDAVLKACIGNIHHQSRGTYGAPRIHAELAADGIQIGRKRVARLMREMSLARVSRRKGTRTTRRDHRLRPAPDLVERRSDF